MFIEYSFLRFAHVCMPIPTIYCFKLHELNHQYHSILEGVCQEQAVNLDKAENHGFSPAIYWTPSRACPFDLAENRGEEGVSTTGIQTATI